jgi:hypothetical protein
MIKLQGGLGNQMFQYAAGKRLAMRRNAELKADGTLYETEQNNMTPRSFELSCFDMDVQFAQEREIQRFKKEPNLMYRIRRRLGMTPRSLIFTEKQFSFDPAVLELPDDMYIQGYWVSEKYFKDIEETIRKDFTFSEPLEGKNKEIAGRIGKVNSVSIHVRRGDYVASKKTNSFHGTCDISYYEKAIEYIAKRVDDPHFFVFSDDIEWVKENLSIPYTTEYIDWNTGKESYRDMQLMSLCKHNIIANSTFSWWGAWLNANEGKIVVAPKRWFKAQEVNTDDLFPKEWVIQ